MGRTWTGCDCWGMVRLFYWHELKIELPVAAVPLTNKALVRDTVLEHLPSFEAIDAPLRHCVVLMQGGSHWHIGVCVDPSKGLVLHSSKKNGAIISTIPHLKRTFTGCVKYLRLKQI